MKEMYADGWLGLIGLLFFVLFFAGVLVWIFRPGAKKKFREYGEIPFKDEDDDRQS